MLPGVQGARAEQQADQLHHSWAGPGGDLQDRAKDQDRGQDDPPASPGDCSHQTGAGHLAHCRRGADRCSSQICI